MKPLLAIILILLVPEVQAQSAGIPAISIDGGNGDGQTYSVTLDVATLPDGITLRDPDRATLEVLVEAGQEKTTLFPLSSGDAPADDGDGNGISGIARHAVCKRRMFTDAHGLTVNAVDHPAALQIAETA